MNSKHLTGNRRVYAFDLLKFFAIAAIVLHHYQQITHAVDMPGIDWYGGSFYWGNLVELFFIISGFFTYSSIRRVREGGTFGGFYLRKYLRFFPMLAISGFVCLLVQATYSYFFDGSYALHTTLWNVVASLSGFERWFDTALMINNPMWYISVLLLCMALFFVITRSAVRNKCSLFASYGLAAGGGLLMKALCESYGVSLPFCNVYIARGLICFFTGLLIAMFFRSSRFGGHIASNSLALVGAVGVVALFVVLYIMKPSLISRGDPNVLYYSLCFIIYPALMVICNHDLVRRITASDKLSFLGGAAYNMYVWHVPLIILFMMMANIIGFSFANAAAMYGFLVICFVFGCLSSRFIDGPISKRIYHWLSE